MLNANNKVRLVAAGLVACSVVASLMAIAQSKATGGATLTVEQAAWLKANAHELSTVKAGSGFEDLEPFRAMVGDARIVGLGEGTHGTKEYFQAKHRLLEFLVEEMGFSIFSIEANMPESYALNDYVLGKYGDVNALIGGMYFWTWNTEEVREMVEWMRAFNAREKAKGSGRSVQFTGNDMQTGTVALRIAREFLVAHDAEFARSRSDSFARLDKFNPHEAGGFGCVTGQIPIDQVRGKKILLSGWVRTENLRAGWAGLWLRVDGARPFFDNMGDRGLRGTADWTYLSTQTTVPDDAMAVYFGLVMPGIGDGWFDQLKVEIDGEPWSDPGFDLDFESAQPKGLVHADPSGGPPPVGYEYAIDSSTAKHGERSGHLRSKAEGGSAGGEAMKAAAKDILDHMEASRDRYVEAVGEGSADWAIQNARVVYQWSGLAIDAAEGSKHRDRCMAENVAWILEHNPGAKIVLWAHNWHVRDESPWMGSHLRQKFGKDYVNLAFCSSRGEYYAMQSGGGGMGTFKLATAPPDSFEAMLDADGRNILLLDLRLAKDGDAGSGWLTEARPFGGVIGAMEMPEHHFPARMQGPFDFLLYVKETTAAKQLPGRTAKKQRDRN